MRCPLNYRLSAYILILCFALSVSGQDAQWLSYHTCREAKRLLDDISSVSLKLQASAGDGVALPDFEFDKPYFAEWRTPMVDSGSVWLALARSRKYSRHDRLYIDTDHDGDLADEEPVAAYRTHQYGATFGPVRVLFDSDDGPVTYHLHLDFYHHQTYQRLSVSSACWYEGNVRVGGKTWRCQLIDHNVNGTFDDSSADFAKADRIRLEDGGEFTTYFAGRYVEVAGALYLSEPERDGAFVRFTPADDVVMGSVRASSAVDRLSVGGENGLFHASPADGAMRLPVGEYKVYEWLLSRKDDAGTLWQASGQRLQESFDIREDEETFLAVGEPLTATLSASMRRDAYSFSQGLKGQQGESVKLVKDKRRPKAPKLTIANADGSYEETFQFEYG